MHKESDAAARFQALADTDARVEPTFERPTNVGSFINGHSDFKESVTMKRIIFVPVLLSMLFSFVTPAFAQGGQMVCRQLTGCDYTDVNGYVQHVAYGQAAYYYRSLIGQGWVYEQPQAQPTHIWGSNNYSGRPGDALGLTCSLFNVGCR
jgi:hypothetical protein